jgi:hypothetical protein
LGCSRWRQQCTSVLETWLHECQVVVHIHILSCDGLMVSAAYLFVSVLCLLEFSKLWNAVKEMDATEVKFEITLGDWEEIYKFSRRVVQDFKSSSCILLISTKTTIQNRTLKCRSLYLLSSLWRDVCLETLTESHKIALGPGLHYGACISCISDSPFRCFRRMQLAYYGTTREIKAMFIPTPTRNCRAAPLVAASIPDHGGDFTHLGVNS